MIFKLCFVFNRRLLLVLALTCTPLFVACNGSSGEGERVGGIVTVDGEPIEQGSITFKPKDGESPNAGAIIKEGKYETILAQGKSRVEIRVPVVVGQRREYDTPDSPLLDVTKESLPMKYNKKTELEIDVVAGTNIKDWELSTK